MASFSDSYLHLILLNFGKLILKEVVLQVLIVERCAAVLTSAYNY